MGLGDEECLCTFVSMKRGLKALNGPLMVSVENYVSMKRGLKVSFSLYCADCLIYSLDEKRIESLKMKNGRFLPMIGLDEKRIESEEERRALEAIERSSR